MYSSVPVDTLSFAGHESFPLRFTWLKKAYDSVVSDPEFFLRDDAMVALGVGKNMVRAIRHWATACQVCEEEPHSRGRRIRPTALGVSLLADPGWDPYLEDLASIWWLHWKLVTNTHRATTWSWMFGRPRGNRFSRDVVVHELSEFAKYHQYGRAKATSLKRDLTVLIRSYAGTSNKPRAVQEDNLDSPFSTLGLIRPTPQKGEFELVASDHASLPLAMFEAALVEYCTSGPTTRRSVSLDELLYSPFSPGRTFRLSEDGFMRRILELQDNSDIYRYDETAGLRQLLITAELPDVGDVLDAHYDVSSQKAAA